MNQYALVQRKPDGVSIVGTVKASTQGQAIRKLCRAHHIDQTKLLQLGFTVEFQKLGKGANRAENS